MREQETKLKEPKDRFWWTTSAMCAVVALGVVILERDVSEAVAWGFLSVTSLGEYYWRKRLLYEMKEHIEFLRKMTDVEDPDPDDGEREPLEVVHFDRAGNGNDG